MTENKPTSGKFEILFAPELTADQVTASLTALADFYRACGGAGLQIDFECADVLIGETTHAVR